MKELNIKKWYIETYNDSMGKEISHTITFNEVYKNLGNVYNLLGVGDSIIRERVFQKIAELVDVEYNVIYNQWLN